MIFGVGDRVERDGVHLRYNTATRVLEWVLANWHLRCIAQGFSSKTVSGDVSRALLGSFVT